MIDVATRSDRSFGMATLQTLVRPFRPNLVKPGKPQPAGSNKLTVHRSAKKHCHVEQRQIERIWVYDLVPKSQQRSTVKAEPIASKHIY